jgi:hypothetical protein
VIGRDDNKLTVYLDKLLPKLVVAFLCGLIVAQVVLFMDGTRQYISKTDKLEGEQLALHRPGAAKADAARTVLEPLHKLRKGKTLSFSVVSKEKRPSIVVRVNNQVAGNFRDGTVRLTVYEQDYLEIDASGWREPVRLRVEADPGILLPISGVEFETIGDTLAVGQVKLK